MVSKLRSQRIADRIRQELSELMLHDVSDPRLVGVHITDVTVDRELAYAEVYLSALEGSQRAADVIEAMRHAQGFLRSALSQRVELRVIPRLRFHWDPTMERAEHIEKLLASLHTEPPSPPADEENEDG